MWMILWFYKESKNNCKKKPTSKLLDLLSDRKISKSFLKPKEGQEELL